MNKYNNTTIKGNETKVGEDGKKQPKINFGNNIKKHFFVSHNMII